MLKHLLSRIAYTFKINWNSAKVTAKSPKIDLSSLSPMSQAIFKDYQVRRTKKQKTAFINYMISMIPGLRIEPCYSSSHNLVWGDIHNAKYIFTAHYDTPNKSLFSIIHTPKRPIIGNLHLIKRLIPSLVITVLLTYLLCKQPSFFSYLFTCILLIGFLWFPLNIICILGVTPNKNNFNDNTSGIVTLCELIQSLDKDEIKVAFVFFDNEEKGCLGAKCFNKFYKEEKLDIKRFKLLRNKKYPKDKLLINFDCVANGDHMVFTIPNHLYDELSKNFDNAYNSNVVENVRITEYTENASKVKFSSDQKAFHNGVGVSALCKDKNGELCLPHTHTAQDTIFQTENIQFLVEGTKRLLKELP